MLWRGEGRVPLARDAAGSWCWAWEASSAVRRGTCWATASQTHTHMPRTTTLPHSLATSGRRGTEETDSGSRHQQRRVASAGTTLPRRDCGGVEGGGQKFTDNTPRSIAHSDLRDRDGASKPRTRVPARTGPQSDFPSYQTIPYLNS